MTIQIVEDHKVVAQSIGEMISNSGIGEMTGIFYNLSSYREGLKTVGAPDILLLDIGLPDGNGVDFCAELLSVYPNVKVMMLTGYSEFNIAKRAIANGALGYVLKNATNEEVLAGIAVISQGEQFLSEEIEGMFNQKRNEATIWLTKRETEVLQRIAEGYTDQEIADKICRSLETVRTHRKNLFIKLQATNSAMLVKKGYDMHLLY